VSPCGSGGEGAESRRGEGWEQGTGHFRMQVVTGVCVFNRLSRQSALLDVETEKTLKGKEEVYE